MKRFVLLLMLAMMVGVASAQEVKNATTTAEQKRMPPKSDCLADFTKIKIDASVNLILRRVKEGEEVRIVYDTKGDVSSKFRYKVDEKGVLTVSEKVDAKRLDATDVVIYYKSLSEVKIAHATAEFEDEISTSLFDLSVSGGATVSIAIKALDVAVECTGASSLVISGEAKYLTMRVSTANVDCGQLSTISTTVEASNSAQVRVVVSERLEAKTSTGGKLFYRGTPSILRNHNAIFGGNIVNVN